MKELNRIAAERELGLDGARPPAEAQKRRAGSRVLGILLLVYILNFVDRQLVGILASSIKRDLALTDIQLGLLGGLAFAMFYTLLGLPVAWYADRRRRVPIVALALLIWSGFTCLCAGVRSFAMLFICRMGVGVGEAGSVAPSYSIVSDTFPPHQRGRAFAILLCGVPVGSACGITLGGTIAAALDWRSAFFIVGLIGVLAVPLVWFAVPEPVRGGFDRAGLSTRTGLSDVYRVLLGKPGFWLLSLGAGFSSIISYGSLFWLPSLLQRSLGLTLFNTALFYGSIVLVGGLIGVGVGGVLADLAGKRDRRGFGLIGAVMSLLAVPAFGVALTAGSLRIAWPLLALAQALSMAWLSPTVTAIQHIVPSYMRASASASFQLILNLMGLGCGPVAIGFISDHFAPRFGNDSLRWSILIGLGFYLLAGAFFWAASRCLDRDWEDGSRP